MKRIFILMMLMPIALVSCKNKQENTLKPSVFPTTEEAYDTKVDFYSVFDITSTDVVFAGDEFIENGHWSEMFESQSVKNRGISGESAEGLKYRIASIVNGHPKAVFIHTGYNDLVAGESAEDVYATISDIVSIAHQTSSETKLYVTNIVKLSPESDINAKIDELNALIESKAESYTFIDAIANISDENGVIMQDFLDPFNLMTEAGFFAAALSFRNYVNVPSSEPDIKRSIVMMGGDVMAEINWPEAIGKNEVYDRAYPNDMVTVIVARLNSFIENQPAKVFVMIPKVEISGMETDALWNTYKDFVKNFNEIFKNTQLYLVSNIPNAFVSEFYEDGVYNAKLQEINKIMAAAQSENDFTFIDPATVFADEAGNLKAEFTYDGENLNAEGLVTFVTMMLSGTRMFVFPFN